ncbi:hypothetical protein FNZ56_08525 [Pseudoluteimonas lycopersici]|uniref:DUF4124 domain-containing protein n=1 Tax=Pseudoluteimonas lycopersici TaxID=1324796 RepID=A0A516V5Y2_9GAMM|nr:hypothetical protein [Lysobacter lycopersici]QDQ73917.1 hypothetical protein FNZ56_08525 [Lysobacter lycopersici]
MRIATRTVAGATLLLGIMLSAHAAPKPVDKTKKLYCWDEGGHKVCGDALPASAAAAARTEISAKSGRTLDTVGRALTPEERVAATAAAQQAQQASDQRMQQQRRDLAMVDSYATESDLRRAYGDRSDLLDASIKASVLSLQNLHQSLLSLLSHAADDELSDKPVAKPRQDAMRSQHAELMKQQRILAEQRADRAALDTELADAVQRYRALKHADAATMPEASPPAETP